MIPMKKKNFLYLFLSLLILFLGLRMYFSETTGLTGHSPPGVEEEIVAVRLTGAEGEAVNLEIDEEGRWLLDGEFMANVPAVRDMRSVLRNLEIRRPVPLSDMEAIHAQLGETGVEAEVFVQGHWIPLPGDRGLFPRKRKIRHFLIGEDSPGGEGTYLRQVGENEPVEVYVPGEGGGLKRVFNPATHIWRDPVVVDLEPSGIMRVETSYSGDEPGFVLEQSAPGEYHLYDGSGEEVALPLIRSDRLHRYLNSFSGLYYERLLPGTAGDPPGDVLPGQPSARVYITDDTGLETRLYFFRREVPDDGTLVSEFRNYDPNRFYLQVNEGDFALAQYYVFHAIKRPLSYFKDDPAR